MQKYVIPKLIVIKLFSFKNMFWVHKLNISVDVSFTHPKHMLLLTVIKIVHKLALFTESLVTEMKFRIASITEI